MIKYICEGCDKEIKEGLILILTLDDKFAYLHSKIKKRDSKAFLNEAIDINSCMHKYMAKGHDSVGVVQIRSYSDLKEQAKGAH